MEVLPNFLFYHATTTPADNLWPPWPRRTAKGIAVPFVVVLDSTVAQSEEEESS